MQRVPDVKILVLTLLQAKDRQARIKALLNEAGIPFEFFYGVDGRTDKNPVEAIYDKSLRLRLKGAPLSPGQLGCYASHFNIWKTCVETQQPLVVLEDDVTFDESLFKDFLDNISALPEEAGCVRLFENKTRNHKEYPYLKFGGFSLMRYTKGPMSTMGYYLTPQAAERFLNASAPLFLSVDIYMDRYWVNNVMCCGVKPGFVFHDYEFESMIGYEKDQPRRSLGVTIFREIFTLTERIRRYFHNRKFGKPL
ncbi:MAG: epitope biosynthesis protein [Alteromonadaceae bacterium]|nr:epitope biosynthesis protein [Alteromonadaceae bacterium]MBH87269.1 epitope biosynthesis protein [Alteromonadaceae bacterium]|tara:strand:+ start:12137 stop:12892 length:756 start_codon:yes stop_codon:yes gene_type:complete